ncbi:uncharacterized protein LOC112684219 [Sipha flava]|uniref:Uncharacterized protein LOC112684219 n=2 Tax=Sipha flava TaxID=143950 RepID=A0A8B8FL77_9HEMI|nr:uncharacterized protein LOC112684219 [Sipha flava]
MGRTMRNKSMSYKKKSLVNDLSIIDAENFEPPQLSSTPAKTIKRNSNRILKDNNSLNISVIKKQDQTIKVDTEIEKQLYKPNLPIIEEDYNYNRVPELFCSDPEEESTTNENTGVSVTNDSDDKWTTLSDTSENKSYSNVSDLLAEIDADVEPRFDKVARRSYPGRKRSNKSLYDDDEEEEKNIEVKVVKKDRKPKQKKIDPQEEALIQSINEHFNDVETFSLVVEKNN